MDLAMMKKYFSEPNSTQMETHRSIWAKRNSSILTAKNKTAKKRLSDLEKTIYAFISCIY